MTRLPRLSRPHRAAALLVLAGSALVIGPAAARDNAGAPVLSGPSQETAGPPALSGPSQETAGPPALSGPSQETAGPPALSGPSQETAGAPALSGPSQAAPPSVQGPALRRAGPVELAATPLREVGPWGASATSPLYPPLPSDLWARADGESLAFVLRQLGPDLRFPTLQRLVRQAVFSGGSAPVSGSAAALERFAAAARLGPPDLVWQLFQTVPRLASDPALMELAADAALLAGEDEAGCRLVLAVQDARLTGPALQELRAACYALGGEIAAAELALDLARAAPEGAADEPWYARALAAIAQPGAVPPPPLRGDSGRTLALSRAAGAEGTIGAPGSQPPAVLQALAGRPGPQQAVFAGEAVATGVLDPAAWARVLPPPVLTPSVPASLSGSPPPGAGSVTSPAGAPAAAPAGPVPAMPPPPAPPPMQGWALGEEMVRAPTVRARAAIARRLAPVLAGVERATPETALRLAEAALWDADPVTARRLIALSGQRAPDLELVASLLDGDGATLPVQRRLDAGPAGPRRAQALRDVALAWAAGYGLDQASRANLLGASLPEGRRPPAGILLALEIAADRGSVAEVVLLAGMALQGHEPHGTDTAALVQIISALGRVGLPDAARGLARDAILAQRLAAQSPVQTGVSGAAPAGPAAPAGTAPVRPPAATPARPSARPSARPADRPAGGPAATPSGTPAVRPVAPASRRP